MSHSLPERPDLRMLKRQARELMKAGGATQLAEALHQIARRHGFDSWPRLKQQVEALNDAGRLRQAIARDDLPAVAQLLRRRPELLHAPIGYGGLGALTWAAECRGGPPAPERLAIARFLIAQGADVHEGGDAPLMRAALRSERIPMMALLLAQGADPNARYKGHFPILHAPCETLEAGALQWLLAQGAQPGEALDALLGGYERGPRLAACIAVLREAGATTRFALPGVLELLSGDLACLAALLDADPARVHAPLHGLAIGASGARRLLLDGATLLHVAAEFGQLDAARLLHARGADLNASGSDGATPLFHAVSQFNDAGLAMTDWLLRQGARRDVVARLPGHYERPDEWVEGTALDYARRFPGEDFPGSNAATLARLQT